MATTRPELYEPGRTLFAVASLPVLHLWPQRLEIFMEAFADEYRPTLIRLQIRICILRKFLYRAKVGFERPAAFAKHDHHATRIRARPPEEDRKSVV